MARTTPPDLSVDQRLSALEQQVKVLESERPGRKPMPLLAIRQRGVCAIDPSSDSGTCEFASIYRYQSGCHGDACRLKQHQAYERRKTRPTATVTLPKAKAKKPPATKPPAKAVEKPAPKRAPRTPRAATAASPRKTSTRKPAAKKTVTKRVSKKVAA